MREKKKNMKKENKKEKKSLEKEKEKINKQTTTLSGVNFPCVNMTCTVNNQLFIHYCIALFMLGWPLKYILQLL
jgi:NADH:ubiquinone oxidoreductase subunit H